MKPLIFRAPTLCLLIWMLLTPYSMADGNNHSAVTESSLSSMLKSLRGGTADPKQDNEQLQLQQFSFTVNGKERTYYVHVPPKYAGKTALPLVFAFHGAGGRARLMPRLTGLSKFADKHSFILVYPEGLNARWNDGNGGKSAAEVEDVNFVRAILDKVEKSFKIDKKRVYAAGVSNGGFFSQYLCINMPDTFAAVASVAATIEEHIYKNLKPPKPVPILFIMGDDDMIVPYEGGSIGVAGALADKTERRAISAQNAVNYWVKADQCGETPVISNLPDARPSDGTHVIRKIYSGGQNGSEVVFFVIKNGGHTWPSGWQYLPDAIIGLTSKAIDADDEIWKFFQRHHL
jgi:polyhydroxybutyrate depolymerase